MFWCWLGSTKSGFVDRVRLFFRGFGQVGMFAIDPYLFVVFFVVVHVLLVCNATYGVTRSLLKKPSWMGVVVIFPTAVYATCVFAVCISLISLWVLG